MVWLEAQGVVKVMIAKLLMGYYDNYQGVLATMEIKSIKSNIKV
ncbi:MAG: hypothetical protein ACLRQF_12690 [Thomasclavelia ramosa]